MDSPNSSSTDRHATSGDPGRYRERFLQLGMPILVLDSEAATIIEANNHATNLFGYSQEDLAGMDLDSLACEDGTHLRDRIQETVDSPSDDGPFTVECRMIDGNGNDFWIEADLQPISNEFGSEILATIRTGSERATRNRDLRTFKTAVENAGHSIYWTDVDGTIEYANPAFERITGYDRDAVIGENPRLLQSGEMDESYYRELWDTILDGEIFEREVINESKTGDQFVVSQTIAPITGPTGDIQRYVAVNSDITDRKRREDQLEAEKERVRKLHERLSVMNRILRHDIRSSVNIIKGNAELADSSDRELGRALETVIEEADRLRRIADSVRHIETAIGETDAQIPSIDVATLVQTKVLKYQNEYPKAVFETDLPDSALVRAREQFGLAVDHLLQNAIEHHDRPEPSVQVSVEQKPSSGTIEILIEDDGPGIPEAEVTPLQERRETPLEHTSGLGLWLTQWIVDVSRGTLSFETDGERGTTARIELETP